MSPSSRYLAFLAYLLGIPGALCVLLARRDDPFARFHARQSLAIGIAAVLTPIIWAIVAWGGTWIPTAGPLIGLSLFALVIAAYVGLAVSWLTGLVFALNGTLRPVPLVGSWVVRRPKTATNDDTSEGPAELVEGVRTDV